jgi:hypothetical protein
MGPSFAGKPGVAATDERAFASTITMNHASCIKKNSGSTGPVVYGQRRASKEQRRVLLKIGSFDHFLNMQVAILTMAQIVLCIVCGVANYAWQ